MNPLRSGFIPDHAAPAPNTGRLSDRAVAALSGYSSDHRPVVVHTPHGVVVTYNAGNASDAKVRADLLRLAAGHPLVIGLQEVADRSTVIHGIPGYRTIQYHGRRGAAHVAMLVRSDAHVGGSRLVHLNDRAYVGHHVKGAEHSGGYTQAKQLLEVTVNGIRFGVAHFVPSVASPLNVRARRVFRTQTHNAAKWLRDGGDVLMGDFNAPARFRLLAPLRALAHPHSAPSHGRRAIDIVWTRGR